ncbi:MAG: hypothetical protein NTW27_00255 [Deltaproteobacteria bacterium]|jgi:hypothetical protein|nr:hypothetical protein [Deltaproteobacteria bacterium]
MMFGTATEDRELRFPRGFLCRHLILSGLFLLVAGMYFGAPFSSAKESDVKGVGVTEDAGRFSWEMPGRVSIYDLQFGPAVLKDNQLTFIGNGRSFNAELFGDKLTLMVRFSYNASQPEVPLKFVIKLPDSRQYEETVHLISRSGQYSYHFTVHNPRDFLGSGSVYLYYGFSIVDVLDFTIMPGS